MIEPASIDRRYDPVTPWQDPEVRLWDEPLGRGVAGGARPAEVLALCAALDRAGLHDDNVLTSGGAFYDWGDVAGARPFAGLAVTPRVMRDRFGRGPGEPALHRLADVYPDAWRDTHTLAGLRETLRLALRLASFGRATAGGRVFPGDDLTRSADRHLTALAPPGPLEERVRLLSCE